MDEFRNHGPTITYVTDPALALEEQYRVIRELIQAASICRLRIAIRLPDASDDDVGALLVWYFEETRAGNLEPPLVHNRPALAASLPAVHSWLPARELAQGTRADVYSVHSRIEAMQAFALGASEVIYGHVFATESHPGEPGQGLDALSEIDSIAGISVTAIGGIDEASIGDVSRAEVSSVAMIRSISRSPNIAKTIGNLKINWERNQI